jgi:hypothetical protein
MKIHTKIYIKFIDMLSVQSHGTPSCPDRTNPSNDNTRVVCIIDV